MSTATRSAPQRPVRVLMVEDNEAHAELIQASLEAAKYPATVQVVDDPENFQKHLETGGYEVVLSDHHLRNWTGRDALAIARRCGSEIPLIVVTSSLGDEAAAEYMKLGASDYVLKHRLQRLPMAMDRALRERDLARQATKLQQQIVAAKRDWELAFDATSDGVLLLDSDGRIRRINRAAAQCLGAGFAAIIGKLWC